MIRNAYYMALEGRIDKDYVRKDLLNFLKGIEGESKIESILNQVKNLCYDYNLELDLQNRIQIDFLVVDDKNIINLEVKNYSGDYFIHNSQMRNEYGNAFNLPFHQINRTEYELEHIKSHLQIDREIKSYLIFTNPTFTLHTNIPHREKVLLPTELHKLPKKFQNYKIEENRKLLNKIITMKKDFSQVYPNTLVPFNDIKPGLRCQHCRKIGHIFLENRKRHGYCMHCTYQTTRQELYLHNLRELYVLKRKPFTINDAQRWCDNGNKDTIRLICRKHFKNEGKHSSFYSL